MENIARDKKPIVTIETVGNTPVFAIFDTKEEAFMALLNLGKDKVTLQEN